jgi:PAS domain S-box-containing protein
MLSNVEIGEKHSAPDLENMHCDPSNGEACADDILKLEERFGDLLDAAPDAMVFVERSGRIVLANEGMEKLFGYSREELIGNDLHMLIPQRFHARHRDNVPRFFDDPRQRAMGSGLRIYGRKKDGSEFRADISLSPLRSNNSMFVAAAIRDISDRVRAEEQIAFDYEIQRAINIFSKSRWSRVHSTISSLTASTLFSLSRTSHSTPWAQYIFWTRLPIRLS